MKKYLFIDRDGTLIVEPKSQQIDRLSQLSLLPNVVTTLVELQKNGFTLVMISNQDGLGTKTYPMERFTKVQEFLLAIFNSQGIEFESVRICPHYLQDACNCRKPSLGLVVDYLADPLWDRASSYVIGDRESDLILANKMGITGMKIEQDDPRAWRNIKVALLSKSRVVQINRITNETDITCTINIDDDFSSEITTGILFFDHMLQQFAKQSGIYINLKVQGDVEVDDHHTIEDTAIVLGQAIKKALGNKFGIGRYGFLLPMDESLATIAIDLSGRSYLKFDAVFNRESIGGFATEMVHHFFRSFCENLQATLHISVVGENTHHMIEAIFKGVGKALQMAMQKISTSLPTTKGIL